MWNQGAKKGDQCHCWKVWGRDKCKGVYPGGKAADGDDDDDKKSDHDDDDNDANDNQRIVNSMYQCPIIPIVDFCIPYYKSITHRYE